MFFFHNVREVMMANVRFVFVCFGKRFSRGVPFVRSFVYSLDFLLFLTASLLNCGEDTRFATSTAQCWIMFRFVSLFYCSLPPGAFYLCSLIYLLYSSIFCFACKTTAMFNRFVSIYDSIIAKNGVEKNRAERIFANFLNVRFPPLAFSPLLTTWIVNAPRMYIFMCSGCC